MMDDLRPNPDELLHQMKKEEEKKERGKLKIFFGYAAGVGKTYAMLDAAHTAQKVGVDVVVGYVEPHARPDTIALLKGLEQLPVLKVAYKGITLREFDLDAALKRHPQLILVDELAHTNAQGCRNMKRYHDIEELLLAGIDVYTTVNVQHLESLNDIVASITQVVVRERIPDSVFDSADQVELVDIEPEELLVRLGEGKIYRAPQAKNAMDHFFSVENLVALREIALRRTADRVNRIAERARNYQTNDYFTGEHILICLSSSPSNAKVIRTAARMVTAFHAMFTALFVETPGTRELSDENRSRLRENLKLAEQLGARIATVYGDDVPYQIAQYARVSGVSKIVIGRSNNKARFWQKRITLVERLGVLAPNLDVYVIPDNQLPYSPEKASRRKPSLRLIDFVKTVFIMAACTLAGYLLYHLNVSESNIIVLYLLGVLFVSNQTEGKLWGALASLVSVLTFNFCFTDPRYTFDAIGPEYPITFLIMLVAALITSTLTTRVRNQSKESALQAHRTEILLETSQKLQRAVTREEIVTGVAQQITKLLECPVVIYQVRENVLGNPKIYWPEGRPGLGEGAEKYLSEDERAVADWTVKNKKPAGIGTDTLPGAMALYLPVHNGQTVFGVVSVVLSQEKAIGPFEQNLLFAMLGEFAQTLEKEELNEAQKEASMQAEKERLRANLLRAISHDLRTPLTSISADANILLADHGKLDKETKTKLYGDIYDDSLWLINLVENLLSVTKLEDGTMNIRMEPELMEEIIDEAMRHISRKSTEHIIQLNLSEEMLMARVDARLLVQVVINIVDNAVKYTPPGSHITITTFRRGNQAVVEIADNGNGIPDEDKARLFDMFYTAGNCSGDSRRGLGLGLSLCKSIITAHGGEIYIRDNKPKGSVFGFTLQLEEVTGHDQ